MTAIWSALGYPLGEQPLGGFSPGQHSVPHPLRSIQTPGLPWLASLGAQGRQILSNGSSANENEEGEFAAERILFLKITVFTKLW